MLLEMAFDRDLQRRHEGTKRTADSACTRFPWTGSSRRLLSSWASGSKSEERHLRTQARHGQSSRGRNEGRQQGCSPRGRTNQEHIPSKPSIHAREVPAIKSVNPIQLLAMKTGAPRPPLSEAPLRSAPSRTASPRGRPCYRHDRPLVIEGWFGAVYKGTRSRVGRAYPQAPGTNIRRSAAVHSN
jgi:hypothetical protein